jgi:hypothetical protein
MGAQASAGGHMPQDAIFAPLGALALLTFIVLGFVPATRFPAVFSGQVTPEDFKLGESARVPPNVVVTNRNYMNLLELPVLFYIAGLMFYVAGRVDGTVMAVGWTYVALRAIHSAIHLTYNNVLHRLIAFAVSNFVLAAFWVLFFIRG